MIPFVGYEIPVHYSSGIVQEHLHCRKLLSWFDISYMGQIFVSGEKVAQQLEKLTPSNISGLKIGQQRYAVLTNKYGGIIDDIIINRTALGFLLVVNAVCVTKDYRHLKQHLSSSCYCKVLQNQALFALQGQDCEKVMAQLSKSSAQLSFMQSCTTKISGKSCLISRCGYTGEDGFEISTANQYAQTLAEQLLSFSQVSPAGLGARNTLRLEAGLNLYGHELTESISPVEIGLNWTFRKNATNFLGADIINSQLNIGVTKKQVGLLIEGKIALRENCELFDSQNNLIGLVTSGSFCPSIGRPIALACIDSSYKSMVLFAKVRKHRVLANITRLPFIQHSYHKI